MPPISPPVLSVIEHWAGSKLAEKLPLLCAKAVAEWYKTVKKSTAKTNGNFLIDSLLLCLVCVSATWNWIGGPTRGQSLDHLLFFAMREFSVRLLEESGRESQRKQLQQFSKKLTS
jgi:hypothetical protein